MIIGKRVFGGFPCKLENCIHGTFWIYMRHFGFIYVKMALVDLPKGIGMCFVLIPVKTITIKIKED